MLNINQWMTGRGPVQAANSAGGEGHCPGGGTTRGFLEAAASEWNFEGTEEAKAGRQEARSVFCVEIGLGEGW